MSDQEKQSLMKMFESVSGEVKNVPAGSATPATTPASQPIGDDGKMPYYSKSEQATTQVDEDGVPLGPTPRIARLKQLFLKQVPSITLHRALVLTEVMKENPGMPKILLRATAFRKNCQTARLRRPEGSRHIFPKPITRRRSKSTTRCAKN